MSFKVNMNKNYDNIIVFDLILMIIAIFNALITKHWLSWMLLIGIVISIIYKKRQ